MLEMLIPNAENPAAKAGKIQAKYLAPEQLASKTDFGQRLKKIKHKTKQGGDEANNIGQGIANQQGKNLLPASMAQEKIIVEQSWHRHWGKAWNSSPAAVIPAWQSCWKTV